MTPTRGGGSRTRRWASRGPSRCAVRRGPGQGGCTIRPLQTPNSSSRCVCALAWGVCPPRTCRCASHTLRPDLPLWLFWGRLLSDMYLCTHTQTRHAREHACTHARARTRARAARVRTHARASESTARRVLSTLPRISLSAGGANVKLHAWRLQARPRSRRDRRARRRALVRPPGPAGLSNGPAPVPPSAAAGLCRALAGLSTARQWWSAGHAAPLSALPTRPPHGARFCGPEDREQLDSSCQRRHGFDHRPMGALTWCRCWPVVWCESLAVRALKGLRTLH